MGRGYLQHSRIRLDWLVRGVGGSEGFNLGEKETAKWNDVPSTFIIIIFLPALYRRQNATKSPWG